MNKDITGIFSDNLILKDLRKYADSINFSDIYLVGGYVRDFLLGLDCEKLDIDIMIIGDALKFASDFAKEKGITLSAVYKNFGTALLEYEGKKVEFVSARKESYNKKSRKPLVKSGTLFDDLSRRDFTINTLAVNIIEPENIIDLFDGQNDIDKKIIRTPQDPEITFFDDPLRMLRAIRFASKYEFSIEKKTFETIKNLKYRLKEDNVVSQERITGEFQKILLTNKPSIGLNLLYLSGIMDIIFPEISEMKGIEQRQDYHHKDVFNHTLEVVDNVSQNSDDFWLRFAALTHDIAKPKTKKFIEGTGWTFYGHEELGAKMMIKIFEKLKLGFSKLEYVQKLIRLHLRPASLTSEEVSDSAYRRLARDAGNELEDLLILCRADITSKNPLKVKNFLEKYKFVEERIIEVQEKDHLRNFQSPVRGDEIMDICGIEPSKLVGILKTSIEEAILDGKIPNEYEPALNYLIKIKDQIIKEYYSEI